MSSSVEHLSEHFNKSSQPGKYLERPLLEEMVDRTIDSVVWSGVRKKPGINYILEAS